MTAKLGRLPKLLAAVGALAGLGLVLSTCALESALAAPWGSYPRVSSNAGTRSWGAPYVKADGSLDSLVIRRAARFPYITSDVDPIATTRPDIASAFRYFNPNCRLTLYTLVGFHWVTPPNGFYAPTEKSYNAQRWRAIMAADTTPKLSGWLWGTDGQVWFDNWNVNLGNRQCVLNMAHLMCSIARTHIVDDWTLDDLQSGLGVSWTLHTMGRTLDLERAGFHSGASIDSAYKVNCQLLVDSLRRVLPPTALIQTNGGDGLTGIAGSVYEGIGQGGGLPDEGASMFYSDTSSYEHPWLLKEIGAWSGNYSQSSVKSMRMNLAINALGHGWALYAPDRDLTVSPLYSNWWYDEYAVTPYPFCRADTTGKNVGWLGEPGDTLVYARQLETDFRGHTRMVPTVTMRWFEHGAVLVNRSDSPFTFFLRATFKRITGSIDPVANNGREDQRFTVPAHDALFVVRKPRRKPTP